MIKVTSEVEIAAPPVKVWRALCDFEAYSRWNPYREVLGIAAADTDVTLKIGPAPLTRRAIRAKIVTFEPGRCLAFRTGVKGWMSAIESFELEASQRGTRLKHSSLTSGLGALLLGRLNFQQDVQAIYGRVDAALAKYCSSKPARVR